MRRVLAGRDAGPPPASAPPAPAPARPPSAAPAPPSTPAPNSGGRDDPTVPLLDYLFGGDG
jgi:hypothetical protein